MGHLDEQQYEARPDARNLPPSRLRHTRKRSSLAPGSTVIMERLAEIYAKSQHIRDAVAEAQEMLKLMDSEQTCECAPRCLPEFTCARLAI